MELITKDLYLICLFEVSLCLGGYALPKAMTDDVSYIENRREKHIFEFLKINKFCLMGK